MLHVTNGDSAAITLRATGIGGEVLSWQDALHEGPVPAGLSLSELSLVRARYIASQGWADEQTAVNEFAVRDAALLDFARHDEIVLWFEHDLYDQLQLIQILSTLAEQDLGKTRVSVICINRFPGIERFFGLGQLNVEQLASLFPERIAVTAALFQEAVTLWRAFRSPDPTHLTVATVALDPALPFASDAIFRFLEEYPSTRDGLGRTERQALLAIRNGHRTLMELFAVTQAVEEAPFLGDSILWSRLGQLASGRSPLIESEQGVFDELRLDGNAERLQSAHLSLSRAAEKVLDGAADAIELNGIDRWFGGVHLTSDSPKWRWDRHQNCIIRLS